MPSIVFDLPLASPIGVRSGALLDSKSTTLAARHGYNVVIYAPRIQGNWQMDIHLAVHALSPGQILIVSVDDVQTARLAKEAGAPVIEVEYIDPEITREIAEAIAPTPLVVKIGALPDLKLLENARGIVTSGLECTRQAKKLIAEQKLGLRLLACGEMTEPNHFDEYLEAGADVALGTIWDPSLAERWKEKQVMEFLSHAN